MSGSRLVRGTRSRLFLYVAVVVVVGMAVYVFHGAQLQLDDARKVADKCQQQQESLSAQLQVIFEYKLRLEKSLQQEKADHRKTHEELEKRADSEKEANNKHSALQQQYKLLQSQHEDLSEDCHKAQMTQVKERSNLEAHVQTIKAELAQVQAAHKKSLNSVKLEYTKLEVENVRLQKELSDLREQTSKTSNKVDFLEKENKQLQKELEKALKELELYHRNPPLPAEKPREHKRNVDNSLNSPVKDSIAAPIPSPASSVSSPAAAAAQDMGMNADSQMNVLQQPLLNQESADNKVRSSPSSSHALPVADKLPMLKSSSKSMTGPGQQLGYIQLATSFAGSSSLRPAPAMQLSEVAVAGPPPHASNDMNIEQLQSRIEQMLNSDKDPRASKDI